MSINITISDLNGTPVLELKGRVKGEGDEKLQKTMESVIQNKPAKVVIDVSNTAYIDSHGLGIIIYFHKMLQNENCTMIILNANPDPESYMNRLIEITNLDKVLNVVKSLKDA